MPYVDTEWAVIVEGTLAQGEVWANRWTIQETGISPDLDDAAARFHTYYTNWATNCADSWTASMISFRNLANSEVVQPSWTTIVGSLDADSPLPSECALRVSLSAAPNRHGGPFLAGASTAVVDDDGRFLSTGQTAQINSLNSLMAGLVADGFALRLDSPSDTETKAITAARLGRQFDVIRKRRNNAPEAFASATVVPQVLIRSHLLAKFYWGAAGDSTVATVPTGHRWLIKEIAWLVASSSACLVVLQIEYPGQLSAVDRRTLGAESPVAVPRSLVLDGPVNIRLYRNAAAPNNALFLSGIDFALV